MIVGDFNDIMSSIEKKGGVITSTRKCNIFKDRNEDCKLMALQVPSLLGGGIFSMVDNEFMRSWIDL